MMNDDNLKTLSSSEAREFGTMGGIASGESRRKRRELREALDILLSKDVSVTDEDGMLIKVDGAYAVALGLFKKALEGDTRAFVELRNTVGEMPVQAVRLEPQIDPEVRAEVERLVDEAMSEEMID